MKWVGAPGGAMVYEEALTLETEGEVQILDITGEVRRVVVQVLGEVG